MQKNIECKMYRFGLFILNISVSVEKITNLLTTLYSPFLPQLSKYAKHHEYSLVQKFSKSPLKGKPIPEMIETVKGILPQVILAVKEAMEKVYQFNKGYAFYYFAKGVQVNISLHFSLPRLFCMFQMFFAFRRDLTDLVL